MPNASPKTGLDIKLSRLDPRLGLIAVIILLLAPLIILIIFSNLQERQLTKTNVVEETKLLGQIALLNQNQMIDSSRQLLLSLSLSPEIQDQKTDTCNTFLADLLKGSPQFLNIAVADVSGDVYCTAVPAPPKTNVSDRLFFQKVVNTKKFTLGEYVISKITNKATLQLGYPVIDQDQKVQAVVYVALDLNWVNSIFTEAKLPSGLDFFMIDNNSTILARYPKPEKWVGETLADKAIIQTIIKQKEGLVEALGIDDIPKIFYFAPVHKDANVYLAVGYRKSVAFQNSDLLFKQNLIVLAIISITAIGLAWVVGHLLVVRKAQLMVEADRLKDEFVSTASHELRTPLTAIDGITSMILDGEYGKVNANLKQPLADINTSSERLIHLVNDLLNLSRIQAGRLKYTLSDFSLPEVISEVNNLLKAGAEKKGLKLETANIDKVLVQADPDKVKQVLTNLIGNSLKFTDKGNITISTSVTGKSVNVYIADTGIGIAKDDQAKLFGKFQQLESGKGRPAGTGLGLHISKEMVQKMGGDIWIEKSEVGKGCTFAFSLPIAKSPLAVKIEKEIETEAKANPDQKSDIITKAKA